MRALRGWFGEKKTTFNMFLSLDKSVYRKFHNLIIPGKSGTTQIDHLLVSAFGLFIVETKNMTGWIFGSESQPKWTQSIYGRNYSFQNPLRQTFRQKKLLSEYLNLTEATIHTVIHFVGDCEFRTTMPANVVQSGLSTYIGRFADCVLSAGDIDQILCRLEELASGTTLTKEDHVRSLRERYSSSTTCPKCGSALIERTARHGSDVGSKFLGCSKYPECKYTRNL